jgi:rhodanese-related sulfurtransferase
MFSFLKSIMGGSAGKSIGPVQYKAEFADAKKPHALIDVRTPEEFKSGHIPGAINIDVQVLSGRLKDVPKDKAVVLYCRSGNRSGQAASMLQQAGYTDIHDLGGIGDWRAAGFPIK